MTKIHYINSYIALFFYHTIYVIIICHWFDFVSYFKSNIIISPIHPIYLLYFLLLKMWKINNYYVVDILN